jgi:hypothetical protein
MIKLTINFTGHLVACDFNSPDWSSMYALKANGTPSGTLTPRLACKLFYDGTYLLQQNEANPKTLQDKLPVCTHKFYKKKQWRNQFIEAAKRILCRIAKGHGITPNCSCEDMFAHILVSSAFDLGWNRSEEKWAGLPECDKDRDMVRLCRLAANEEIGALYRIEGTPDNVNFMDWFKASNSSEASMNDHVIPCENSGEEDEDEDD